MNALIREQVLDIFDRVMRNITSCAVELTRCQQQPEPIADTCTVYTQFVGGHNIRLFLYADTALLMRLTQLAMQEEQVDKRDIEDFAREYFNIICGHIVSHFFQKTHIAARFQIPNFCTGRYSPAPCGSCQADDLLPGI